MSTAVRTADGLTPVQAQVRQFIEDFARQSGHPPSYREIADAVGLASLSSVSLHMCTLQKKGYLVREPGRPRTAVVRPGGVAPARPEDAVPVRRRPGAGPARRLRLACGTRRMFRWRAGSRPGTRSCPASRCSRPMRPKTRSCCPGSWSARGSCSCSGCPVIR